MSLDFQGFDYSWARPDPKAMAAAGITVVARYLFGSGKGLEPDELKKLHDAGIGVLLNYEADRGNHLKGAPQGTVDGQNARTYARSLGAPKGTPIYYSCDEQVVTDAQMKQAIAYLHAADSDEYPSRPYGQASVVDAWYRETQRPGWQTIAWSNRISDHACFYQFEINQTWNGSAVDYDRILKQDKLGAWWPEQGNEDGKLADGLSDKALAQIRQVVDEALNHDVAGPHGKRAPLWKRIAFPGRLRGLARANK